MNPISIQPKTCSSSICLATSTRRGRKDADDSCNSCYQKSIKDIEDREKFCSTCEKTVKSPQWYKDPHDLTKDRCAACYQKSLTLPTVT